MKWEKIREALGFLAVVASLVFVGLEIRQNTAATRGQTRQELAALNQEWLTLLTADPAFSELFERAWETEGDIAPSEEYRAEMMMVLEVRRLENVFFQYQEGLVDESALRSYGLQWLVRAKLHPRFRTWWEEKGWREAFHPRFVEFIEASEPAP
jgi:hypothetical protein